MENFKLLALFILLTQFVFAAGKPVGGVVNPGAPPEVRILNETQPAGGTVQIKFSLTEPRPIATGTGSIALDAATFDSIDGVELFSSTGDVFGTAVVQGTALEVNYVSPNGTFGTELDYPLLTIAAHVRESAPLGHITSLGTGVSLAGAFGTQIDSFIVKPGTLSIGGSVSIHDVIPGGGSWPAGTLVRVNGSGFQTGTSVRATTAISNISVVSPNEIDFVLASAAVLDGQRIDMVNPDKSADRYYSYLRGVKQGASTIPLLNSTLPIFSSLTYAQASITQGSQGLKNSMLTALAMQNPGSQTATIRMEAFSPFGISLGTIQIVLPARAKMVRELGEYFETSLAASSTVWVSSDLPLQYLGLGADQEAGTAAAFAIGR